MKTIMIVAAPRTGTNYFLNLLSFHSSVRVFHEVLHPNEAYGFDAGCVQAFSGHTGRVYSGPADPQLVQDLNAQPLLAVDVMRAETSRVGRGVCVFKVFPGHISSDAVRDLIGHVDAVIFIKRRVIDAFISVVKAEASGQFFSADTTKQLPALDPGYFLRWRSWTAAWYLDAALAWMLCNGVSDLPTLTFEEITAGDDTTNYRHAITSLARLAGVELVPGTPEISGAIGKQDKAADPASKVSNYAEFCAALERMGHRRPVTGYF